MKHLTAALAGFALLGACATPPEPCTPDWVEWKSEKILTRFALANFSEVKRLRDFSQKLQGDSISPLLMLQVPDLIEDFKGLASDFEKDVLPALNDAVEQCGSVQKLAPAFTAFLRDEGVGEGVLEWVELLTVIATESGA